jgi:hypothetical protein
MKNLPKKRIEIHWENHEIKLFYLDGKHESIIAKPENFSRTIDMVLGTAVIAGISFMKVDYFTDGQEFANIIELDTLINEDKEQYLNSIK